MTMVIGALGHCCAKATGDNATASAKTNLEIDDVNERMVGWS